MCSVTTNRTEKLLIETFLKGSLKFTLHEDEVKELGPLQQEHFLQATLQSKLLRTYPVHSEFTRLFIKKLINYLENNQEIHDELYTLLCSSMNSTNLKDESSFRHYVIGNDLNNIITTKETNKLVVNGTTGMRTWEAALMLADWALCNKELLSGAKVLELGSGVGFTGITIAKYCNVSSIILTDCHSDVLELINKNIDINFPELGRKSGASSYSNDIIGATLLDWNCIEVLPDEIIPDIIIGADIVYDPSIFEPLCNVLKVFFQRNRNTEVYIASVIRNEETFSGFLKVLDSSGFCFEKVQQSSCVFIEWDSNIDRCLLKIKYS